MATNGVHGVPELTMGSEHFSPYRADGKLYGFICVVTGATEPVGKAIVKELAAHGAACVYACSSPNEPPPEPYPYHLDEYPNTLITPYPLPLPTEEDTLALIDDILNTWGRLDIWISALLPPSKPSSDLTALLNTHALAPFYALTHAPPAMRKTTPKGNYTNAAPKDIPYGSIILVLGQASTHGGFPLALTIASHAALGTVRAGVKMLQGTGVRINAISVGDIGPDGATWEEMRDEGLKEKKERRGIPGEVGKVAGFLASGFSSYVTGANMVVDGGTSCL